MRWYISERLRVLLVFFAVAARRELVCLKSTLNRPLNLKNGKVSVAGVFVCDKLSFLRA